MRSSSSIDKDSWTLKVRVVVPNRGRALKTEVFVKFRIETRASQALADSAVQPRDGGALVLVQKAPWVYERRPAKIGAEFDGLVEVQKAVTPTDRVVSSGGILLRQGTP